MQWSSSSAVSSCCMSCSPFHQPFYQVALVSSIFHYVGCHCSRYVTQMFQDLQCAQSGQYHSTTAIFHQCKDFITGTAWAIQAPELQAQALTHISPKSILQTMLHASCFTDYCSFWWRMKWKMLRVSRCLAACDVYCNSRACSGLFDMHRAADSCSIFIHMMGR